MPDLSVNEAVERVVELNGTVVTVVGALSLDFEGQCINHIPRSQTLYDPDGLERSSIWVDFDLKAIGHPTEWLWQFDSRHVRVVGILTAPNPAVGGCRHFS